MYKEKIDNFENINSSWMEFENSICNISSLSWMLQEAPDSITDGACGLVGKSGDTAMREHFFHLNKKFGKIIKKRGSTC